MIVPSVAVGQNPTLVAQLRNIDLAPAGPSTLIPRDNYEFVLVKRLDVEVVYEMRVFKGPSAASQDNVKASIPKLLCERKSVHIIHVERDPRIFSHQRFADRLENACRN